MASLRTIHAGTNGATHQAGFREITPRPADRSERRAPRAFFAPLGCPIDVHIAAPGKLCVREYIRPTDLKSRAGWLSGRVLELTVKK